MTKKIIYSTLVALILFTVSGYSQGLADAIRFSEQYPEGTARSVAMGNAFVAIGGDMGAISFNPASSGVYKYSEFILTPSISGISNNAKYLNLQHTTSKSKFGISNFGYIGTFETGRKSNGLVNWNIGIVYNKQNNFTGKIKVGGLNKENSWLGSLAENTSGIVGKEMDITETNRAAFDKNISWSSILAWNLSLIDLLPNTNDMYYAATEDLTSDKRIIPGGELNQNFIGLGEGNKSETVINFGGNISNILYFGANIGIQSLYYRNTEKYSEEAASKFSNEFSNFNRTYTQTTSGTGVNFKLGVIATPVDGLRLGASISTPTWFQLKDEWDESMRGVFTDGFNTLLSSPLGVFEYKFRTPFSYNLGIAYTLKQYGVISADYECIDYGGAKFSNIEGGIDEVFRHTNDDISSSLISQKIFRFGLEGKITPAFSARLGYQRYSNYNNDEGGNNWGKEYVSGGVGYVAKSGFFADLAYIQRINSTPETFTLYSSENLTSPIGENKINSYKLLLSIGMRF